jgi:branched-chain amino acid transport system substrate-binding protein
MNIRFKTGLYFLWFLLLTHAVLNAQDKELKYGKTPDRLFPYQNFQRAYKYHFTEPVQFYGAGRDKEPPKDLTEVRIGFLGPLEGSNLVPLGEQMLNGALLALEQANTKGGYHGLPFKLMIHNDVGLWGAAANQVVAMDEEQVWAWLGSIDDIVSHVALRATLKMEIMMVNTGDPDPTFTETNIPWAIRVISDDRQSGYALATYIFEKKGHERVAVIRTNSRYGRVGTMEYSGAAVRLGHPVMIEERFDDGDSDFTMQLDNIKRASPDGILIWANARESALILKQIRQKGMDVPVYTSDRAVSKEFLKIAGGDAEGVVTTCQYNPESDNPKLGEFKQAYAARFGIEADVFAAHAYDGMNLIIKAIEKSGLNRVLIRDVLTDLETFQGYQGVTGEIIFDESWNDIGDIWMAEVKNGQFEFSQVPELARTNDRENSTAD